MLLLRKRTIWNKEIDIVTLIVEGSVRLTVPTGWQEQKIYADRDWSYFIGKPLIVSVLRFPFAFTTWTPEKGAILSSSTRHLMRECSSIQNKSRIIIFFVQECSFGEKCSDGIGQTTSWSNLVPALIVILITLYQIQVFEIQCS